MMHLCFRLEAETVDLVDSEEPAPVIEKATVPGRDPM